MAKTKTTAKRRATAEVTTTAVRPERAPVATIEYGGYRITALLGDTDAAKRLSILHAFDALARAAAWAAIDGRGAGYWIAQLSRTDIRRDFLHVEKIGA